MVTLQRSLSNKLNRIAWFFLLVFCSFNLAGCNPLSIKGKDNSIQYIILGFGVVTVPASKGEVAVTAAKMNTLGLSISNQPGLKFSLGYASGFFLSVPDHANDVRLEINHHLGGAITVDTINTDLNRSLKGEK